jgi:hypothetical protein
LDEEGSIDDTLTIHITGGATPAQLGAGELGKLLQSLEQSVLALVQRDAPEALSEQKLALVAIAGGSVTLDFALPSSYAPSIFLLGSRFSTGNISDLPEKCRQAVLWLGKWCRSHALSLEWLLGGNTVGSITPSLDLVFEAAPQLRGNAELSGSIHSVGGERPSFKLRMATGELLICSCGEELAQQAGKYLYRKVLVEGIARNNVLTGEIASFEANAVSLAERKLSEAFAAIREQFGSAFDAVNVDEFMNRVRGA